MEILKDISVLWSLIHTLVMFLFLFESRYPRKKALSIILTVIIPVMVINFVMFILMDFEAYGKLMLLTLSLPSCILFFILARHRDGRFFFTFCMVDTIALEIIYLTNILNHYLTPDSYLVMFFSRLIIFPLLEILIYKKLRPMYLSVQRQVKKGWGMFAIVGALFYVAITIIMLFPTPIVERPEYLPVLGIMFFLMPIIYLHIIITLRNLEQIHQMTETDNILQLQLSGFTARFQELIAADEKFRVERHNFRHKLKTIAGMIKKEQYSECLSLLEDFEEALDRTKVQRYCQHAVLDATLSSYLTRAQNKGIELDYGFAFPDELPVNESELAIAIANAMENAINACEGLAPEKRFIQIKAIDHPRLMLRIVNSYEGHIEFDEHDIPINHHHDHGFGTRYIAAFCDKNNGFCQFNADGEKFTLMINL
ncbi:MAG: GHKL domain-containing protein [Clostridia bacterium]|nr:GHKL domain-containing protein [Clostridia bacterium]